MSSMSGRGRFGGNPTGAARPLDWLWIWLCLCDPSGMPENGSATMLTARQPAVRVVGFFYPVRAVRPVGSRCPDM